MANLSSVTGSEKLALTSTIWPGPYLPSAVLEVTLAREAVLAALAVPSPRRNSIWWGPLVSTVTSNLHCPSATSPKSSAPSPDGIAAAFPPGPRMPAKIMSSPNSVPSAASTTRSPPPCTKRSTDQTPPTRGYDSWLRTRTLPGTSPPWCRAAGAARKTASTASVTQRRMPSRLTRCRQRVVAVEGCGSLEGWPLPAVAVRNVTLLNKKIIFDN